MTRWNSADFTSTLRQVSWMASTPVLMYLNERATGDPARQWLSSWAHNYFVGSDLKVLVLGCGEGWLERLIAEWPFVEAIDAVGLRPPSPPRRGGEDPAANLAQTRINKGSFLEAGSGSHLGYTPAECGSMTGSPQR